MGESLEGIKDFDNVQIEKVTNGFIVTFLFKGVVLKKAVFLHWDTAMVGLRDIFGKDEEPVNWYENSNWSDLYN